MSRPRKPPQPVNLEYLADAYRQLGHLIYFTKEARAYLLAASVNLSECGKADASAQARTLADFDGINRIIRETQSKIHAITKDLAPR